jgi:putative copper resistance protein D
MERLPTLTGTTAFTEWKFAPVMAALIVVLGAAYAWGLIRVGRKQWPWSRTVCFYVALFVLLVTTQGSIAVYAHHQYWVHMLGHLMLIMVIPALIVAAQPLGLWAAVQPAAAERVLKSAPFSLLTNPLIASIIYAVTVFVTHLTGFMGTLMATSGGRLGEQVLYLIAGWIYFLPAFGDEPIRWTVSYPMRIGLLFVSMPVDTFTGIALMQSGHPMYGFSVDELRSGGATMWIGGDLIMFLAMMVIFALWANSSGEKATIGSWLEAARANALAEHEAQAGIAPPTDSRSNDDDEQLAAYNAWLARLNAEPAPRSRR